MHIEYILIEKHSKSNNSVDKRRVVALFNECFSAVSSTHITICGKRKAFELPYKITCTTATSDVSSDFIYNISIECLREDKMKCAELLEKVHVALQHKVNRLPDYHLINAYDEVSEYYCNRVYPKFQRFERQLRQLIFMVVTKAYGHLWATKTLSTDLKKKLREEIRGKNGSKKEDVLIEAALHEMTMGQLIDYIFYGASEISLPDYIDEHLPANRLTKLSKDDLISLIERSRKKSIWNLYFGNEMEIEGPRAKLTALKNNRNNVAHCKQFMSADYLKSIEYLDLFMPQIEQAIEHAAIQDEVSLREVLLGFGEFTMELANTAKQLGQIIAPAIKEIAEISFAIRQTFRIEALDNIKNMLSEITSLPTFKLPPLLTEEIVLDNHKWLVDPTVMDEIRLQQEILNDGITVMPTTELLPTGTDLPGLDEKDRRDEQHTNNDDTIEGNNLENTELK